MDVSSSEGGSRSCMARFVTLAGLVSQSDNLWGRRPRRPTLAHDRTSQRLDESRAPHLTSASAVAKFLCKTKKRQSEVVA